LRAARAAWPAIHLHCPGAGRLTSEQEFGDIVLRGKPEVRFVRLKDVARIELGAQDYDIIAASTAKPQPSGLVPTSGLQCHRKPPRASKLMAELKERFRADLDYHVHD